jgi:leucine dehydrogenase
MEPMPSIEDLIQSWDGEFVVTAYDAPAATWIFIAIHDRTLGMATGGCRLSFYSTPADGLRDAMRLARGMTYKWAAIDFPFGGGKTVLAAAKPLDGKRREALLLRLGSLIDALGGTYGVGVDLGTSPADMATLGRRTRWVFGKPEDQGGQGDPGSWTAMGVLAGIRSAVEHAFGGDSLTGRSVLVQGVGGVGGPLARQLVAEGATVMVTDAMPGRAQDLARESGARVIAPEETYRTTCDVFAPCAIGGILNERSIPQLQCRVVAGSANNQREKDADADLLHERGVLYAPDFVINAGGAIAHGSLEVLGWTEAQVRDRVVGIRATLDGIFAEAAERGETPLGEANRRATRNLEAARAARSRTTS